MSRIETGKAQSDLEDVERKREAIGEQAEQYVSEGTETDHLLKEGIDTEGLDSAIAESQETAINDYHNEYENVIQKEVLEPGEESIDRTGELNDDVTESKEVVDEDIEVMNEAEGISEVGRQSAETAKSTMEGVSEQYENLSDQAKGEIDDMQGIMDDTKDAFDDLF